ncbi:MAG: hypothetical protein ABI898_07905 [Sphingomonadales bacterium]
MTQGAQTGRRVLPLLFVIQFLSWSAMFCLWVYAVPVIAEAGGDGTGYISAATTVAMCFALYALLGTTLSFAVPGLIRRLDAGRVHGCALLVGGGGIALLGVHPAGAALLLAFAAVGVAWASLSSIPSALVSASASEGQGARRTRLFAFSTVIPQVVVTLLLAALAPAFAEGHASLVMFAGGVAMAIAGVVALLFHRTLAIDIPDW